MVIFPQNKIQPKTAFDLLQLSLISKIPNNNNELVMPKHIMTIILHYTLHPGMIQPLIDLIDSILKIDNSRIDKIKLGNTRASLVQFQEETKFSLEATQTMYDGAINALSEAIKDDMDAVIIKTFTGAKEPIILTLLDMPGINFKAKDNNNKTLLMYSAERGHKNVGMKLLENGADINATTSNGATALMFAAQNGHKATVELLLNKAANINAAENDGITALMLAAQNGHKAIAELLLNNGADINAADNADFTALIFAAVNGLKEIAELLLNKGADFNAATNVGATALILAAQNGREAIVELLLNKGANINAARNNGATALMFAVQNGHKEIAELLLNNGADINAATNDGATAFMAALQNGHKEIVALLLEKGANINATRNNGITALMFAAQHGHKEIVALLLEKGAHINATYVDLVDSATALIFAVQKGHKEIAALLLTEHKKQFFAQALIAPSHQLRQLLDIQSELGAKLTRDNMCEYLLNTVKQKESADEKIKLLEDALKDNAFGTLMRQTDWMGLSSTSSAVTEIQKAIKWYPEPKYGTARTMLTLYSPPTESKELNPIRPSFLAISNL